MYPTAYIVGVYARRDGRIRAGLSAKSRKKYYFGEMQMLTRPGMHLRRIPLLFRRMQRVIVFESIPAGDGNSGRRSDREVEI